MDPTQKKQMYDEYVASKAGVFPPAPGDPKLFNEPFRPQNHMARCSLDVKVAGKKAKIPISAILNDLGDGVSAFYHPWTFTAVMLFSTSIEATALVWDTGPMNITGVRRKEDMATAVRYYSEKIYAATARIGQKRGITYEFQPAPWTHRNTMLSNKLGGRRIRISDFYTWAYMNGVKVKWEPDQINISALYLLAPVNTQVTVTMLPKGGVNMFGPVDPIDVSTAKQLLERILPPFIVDIPDFDASLYRDERKRKRDKEPDELEKRREASIKRWKTKDTVSSQLHLRTIWNYCETRRKKKLGRAVCRALWKAFSPMLLKNTCGTKRKKPCPYLPMKNKGLVHYRRIVGKDPVGFDKVPASVWAAKHHKRFRLARGNPKKAKKPTEPRFDVRDITSNMGQNYSIVLTVTLCRSIKNMEDMGFACRLWDEIQTAVALRNQKMLADSP